MGIVRATLQLRNPSMGNALSPIEVSALVDTGAVNPLSPNIAMSMAKLMAAGAIDSDSRIADELMADRDDHCDGRRPLPTIQSD